jgi:hypothetical protein
VRSSNDGNLEAFDANDELISLSYHEIDTRDLCKNVDPARDIAQLNNCSGLREILFCEIRKRGAKLNQGPPNTVGVVVRTLDPQINVASGARKPMSSNCIRSNEHELNFLVAKRGQYVAEV